MRWELENGQGKAGKNKKGWYLNELHIQKENSRNKIKNIKNIKNIENICWQKLPSVVSYGSCQRTGQKRADLLKETAEKNKKVVDRKGKTC